MYEELNDKKSKKTKNIDVNNLGINFDKLEKEGVKAESLIPVFPSLTFPNHYSIATGCYADDHKITGNQFFSEEYNDYYSY